MRTIQSIEDKYLVPAAELVEAVFTAVRALSRGSWSAGWWRRSTASGFMSQGWS